MPTPEQLAQEAVDTAAEIDAVQGEVAQAEAAIERGEDVPLDRVPTLEQRLRHLVTRAKGLGRRRDDAVEDRRLRQVTEFRAKIEAQIDEEDVELIDELGQQAWNSTVAWLTAMAERNQRHDEWVGWLRDHGVGSFGGAAEPSPENAGVGISGGEIAIGRRRIGRFHVEGAAEALAQSAQGVAQGGTAPAAEDVPVLKSIRASFGREVAELSQDTKFYRNKAGALHSFSSEYIERVPTVLKGMTEVSRGEWIAEQWRSAS